MRGSAEARGLQVIIGLDDLPQLVLRAAVAAIGVGMMPFHQTLNLDLISARLASASSPSTSSARRCALRILRPSARGAHDRCRSAAASPNRPNGSSAAQPAAADNRTRRPRAAAAERAHFPGRTVAGDVVLLVLRDRVVAHAGEEIVRIVVFAHVFEAELPILAGAQPALRRAVGGRRVALRPLAGGSSARSLRSWSGLTLMRSKSGEFAFIRSDYAGAAMTSARLDSAQIRASCSSGPAFR